MCKLQTSVIIKLCPKLSKIVAECTIMGKLTDDVVAIVGWYMCTPRYPGCGEVAGTCVHPDTLGL